MNTKPKGNTHPRSSKKTVFLMVEGKSEEIYFNRLARMFDDYNIRPKVSRDKNCVDIVRNCSRYSKELELYDDDLKVAVFDLDVVNEDELKEAVELAEKEGIVIMDSNLSFEVWLLMHLTDITHVYTQEDYEDRLSELIGRKYKKSEGIRKLLTEEAVKDAVRRGRKALGSADPVECKSTPNSTTLWKLVSQISTNDA